MFRDTRPRRASPLPGTLHAGLLGDHLHVITSPGAHIGATLAAALRSAGLTVTAVAPAEPMLEDVFITLTQTSARTEKPEPAFGAS